MEPTTVRPERRLVGRDAARRRVDSLLERIQEHPEHLVIVGEAGIGKTTLWQYGLAEARARGYRTLTSRPGEDDWARPDMLIRDVAADGVDLTDRLGEPADPNAVAAALLAAVRELAATTPVVLAVDDLPWLDQASVHHLRFLLRRVADLPVALLATARTWDPAGDEDGGVRQIREVRELELGPMPASELRAVLTEEVDALPRTELERLHRESGGNPLFALELARAGGTGRPTSAQAAVQARLADVSPGVRTLLELVAVGGPASLSRLAGVLGPDAEASAREAVQRRLAVVEEDFTVRCIHPLVASAVVAALDPLTRRDVHRRCLELSTDPLERAVHLALGTASVDAVAAGDLHRAAQLAARRGSAHLAAALSGHAVRLSPDGDPELDARIARHLIALAACGQAGPARALAEERLRVLEPGPARTEVVTLRILLDFVGAEGYLRDALRADGLDPGARQQLLELLGWQLGLFKGRLAEGLEVSAQAFEAAQRRGGGPRAARAAAILATTSMMAGHPRRELAVQATLDAGDIDAAGAGLLGIWPAVLEARQFVWDGRIEDARRVMEQMYRRAVTLGTEFQRPYRLRDVAVVELWAGEPDRAAELLAEGLDAARDAGNRQVEAWLAQPFGQLCALRGDAAGADWAVRVLEAWGELADEPPRRVMARHVQGLAAATRGEWAVASDHFAAALELLDALGYGHPGVHRVVPDAVVAAGSANDGERARVLAADLAEAAGRLDSPWVSAWSRAADGTVALLDADASAGPLLEQAVDELTGMGCRLDAVELSWLLGAARIRAGQRVVARRDLLAAYEQADAWGFEGWVAQLRPLLDRLGEGTDVLTATEDRVVELVRAGLRNREIAAELYVTASTVEAHLTRIYRKLGVRSRAELLALGG